MTIEELAEVVKALVCLEGHFRFTSGLHGTRYIDKRKLPPKLIEEVAKYLARFSDDSVQVVVAPAEGAIPLGRAVASHLSGTLGRAIQFCPALKTADGFHLPEESKSWNAATRVLLVEDVITTGLTLQQVLSVVRGTNAFVVGVCSLWNRGAISKQDLGVPWLLSLVNLMLPSYEPGPVTCPGCRTGMPLDPNLGHARV